VPTIPGRTERSLEKLGRGYVFRCPSSTRRGLFHLTFVKDNGEVRCSCEGFNYHGHCIHIDLIPICLQKGHDSKFGRETECFYVQGHEGEHSWGPETQTPQGDQNPPEEYNPLEGLPG
jgi:hypothetical protein